MADKRHTDEADAFVPAHKVVHIIEPFDLELATHLVQSLVQLDPFNRVLGRDYRKANLLLFEKKIFLELNSLNFE